jgi:hypothetical protein
MQQSNSREAYGFSATQEILCNLAGILSRKIYLLTDNTMQQSNSQEAYGFSSTQEMFFILWNTNFHYRVHNSPAITPILSQINKCHTRPAYLSKTYFNISLPSTARSSKKSFSFMFHHRNSLRTPLTPHTRSCFIPLILNPAI